MGPVQLYVAPATAAVDSCRIAPAQTGPLLEATGVPGTALTVVEAFARLFPAAAGSFVADETVTEFVAVPAAPGAVIEMVIGGAAPAAPAVARGAAGDRGRERASGPAGAARGNESGAGGKRIRDRDRRRGRGAAVGDVERVGDGLPGADRRRRAALRDGEIGPREDVR